MLVLLSVLCMLFMLIFCTLNYQYCAHLPQDFISWLFLLRFIVIDEAHTYKGAFGCHTALILRRLRRICSHGVHYHLVWMKIEGVFHRTVNSNFVIKQNLIYHAVYGSDPSFIFCTATSANPREHCMVIVLTIAKTNYFSLDVYWSWNSFENAKYECFVLEMLLTF